MQLLCLKLRGPLHYTVPVIIEGVSVVNLLPFIMYTWYAFCEVGITLEGANHVNLKPVFLLISDTVRHGNCNTDTNTVKWYDAVQTFEHSPVTGVSRDL